METDLFRSRQARRITYFGFVVNALLTFFKLFAGITGRSSAMVADGIHSLSDFLTDIVVLIGFKIVEKPEDESHNYGHEKYETLATVVISSVLFFIGIGILNESLENIIKFLKGNKITRPSLIALFAALLSIIIKEIVYRVTVVVGKKINSSAVIANAWHSRSDAYSSIGTFIGIGGAIFLGSSWTILDPIASLVVSVLIFKVGLDIFLPAINELMESSLKDEEIEKIKKIIIETENICTYHKLRTRRIGTKCAVESHLLVQQEMNITQAHNIATATEKEIKKVMGDKSIVTIHIEPYNNLELNIE